jgi:hypothetical protein
MRWLKRPGYWADGSAMAFPHGERPKLTLIRSAPSGGLSAQMEGPAEPPLPPRASGALPMLGQSSTATALVASSAGALLVS